MRGQPDHGVPAEEAPGGRQRDVLLADVEHRRAGERGEVRTVVDGPEPAVPAARLLQDPEQFEFLGRLDGLVPQLDDVDAAGEGGIHEVPEIAAVLAGVGAQVQAAAGAPGVE